MRTSPDTVSDRSRQLIAGDADAPLVLLGNFEVEQRWALGERGLPRMSSAASTLIVNRMDEFALLLGDRRDHVVLKARPDRDYVSYLTDLGLDLPTVLTPAQQAPGETVTADALADAALLDRLGELGRSGAWLWPHGVSTAEEQLAAKGGLPLAGATAEVCKTVNSKIYSRLLADRLGLWQPEGRVCRDGAELAEACAWAGQRLRAGAGIVAKDAFGVSGKGLLVIRDESVLRRFEWMVARHAQGSLSLVIEEWVDKRMDLNYQVTVSREGTVRLDFVKEALTEGGKHRGHRMPAHITEGQLAEVRAAALAVGELLAEDGYFGFVGVDAMIAPDGRVYPVTEINARNNMSTYQERIREAFVIPHRCALATHYPLHLDRTLTFDELERGLGDLLLRADQSTGLLVNNFATVNAAAAATRGSRGFEGRLYAVVIADDEQAVEAVDHEVRSRLHDVTKGR